MLSNLKQTGIIDAGVVETKWKLKLIKGISFKTYFFPHEINTVCETIFVENIQVILFNVEPWT